MATDALLTALTVVPSENPGGATKWELPSCGCIDVDVFTLRVAPRLPLADFFRRIELYSVTSVNVLLYAVALTLRVTQGPDRRRHHEADAPATPPAIHLTPFTTHRLLAAAFLISTKMLHDSSRPISFYSSLVGCTPADLARLERSLLKLLDGQVLLSASEVSGVLRNLEGDGDCGTTIG